MIPTLSRLLHFDPYGNLFAEHTRERLKKALSPKFLADKAALTVYEWMHPDHPWITRDAIGWLDRQLRPDDDGFEWGSGNGTRWLARRSASLVSVEHYAPWAKRVRAQLEAEGIHNVDYRFVAEDDYLDVIDDFDDDHFDYVLVDGLFRDRALLRSIPKVQPGGFIVFDNVNWYLPSRSRTPHSRSLEEGAASEDFARAFDLLRDWRTWWTTNGVNDTAIFEKPFVDDTPPTVRSRLRDDAAVASKDDEDMGIPGSD